MVYARALPSVQARYFLHRPPPITSPLPFGASPTPSLPMAATSALSPNLGVDFSYMLQSVLSPLQTSDPPLQLLQS